MNLRFRFLTIVNMFFWVLLIMLSGCLRQTVHVSATSYANKKELPSGFLPGNSFAISCVEQKNELQTLELEQKVALVLKGRGYCIATQENADFLLRMNYGITHEDRTVNVEKYIPGQVFTTVTPSGHRIYGSTSSTITYVPETHTFFNKFLTLYAYDAQKFLSSNKPSEIWSGSATSYDEDSDLRSDLDFLLVGLMDSFGKNTQGIVHFHIPEDDKAVTWLRDAYLHTEQ
jgi:hypothetical protein